MNADPRITANNTPTAEQRAVRQANDRDSAKAQARWTAEDRATAAAQQQGIGTNPDTDDPRGY